MKSIFFCFSKYLISVITLAEVTKTIFGIYLLMCCQCCEVLPAYKKPPVLRTVVLIWNLLEVFLHVRQALIGDQDVVTSVQTTQVTGVVCAWQTCNTDSSSLSANKNNDTISKVSNCGTAVFLNFDYLIFRNENLAKFSGGASPASTKTFRER